VWYLDAPWLVYALVDRRVPKDEKQMIVMALLTFAQPSYYPPTPVKPLLPKLAVHQDKFWPADGSLPSLSGTVTERTWQLLSVLGLEKEACSWLGEDPDTWGLQPSYERLHTYVHNLTVTNDVKLGQVKHLFLVVSNANIFVCYVPVFVYLYFL